MKKEIIILGDTELGAGTLTDDFISDNALSQVILGLAKKTHAIDLILNGDTFDFLKCPIIEKGKRSYPRYVTPKISLKKLRLVHQAHKKVFSALSTFLAKSEKHHLYFIYGNHDYDLVYTEVQKKLKSILGYPKQITFSLTYEKHQVYAEHGHMYDLLNRMNFDRLFLNYQGQKILNLGWASFGIISKAMKYKEQYPFSERIHPRPALFSRHKEVAKVVKWTTIKHFLTSVLYYPFRYLSDPTYTLPRDLMGEMLHRIRKLKVDLEGIIDIFLKKKQPVAKRNKILVFGHVHDRYIDERPDKVLIRPGSWRDEYDLDQKSGILIPRTKYYVRIVVQEKQLQWELVPVTLNRQQLDFSKVIKDEKKWLRIVAEEEDFHPRT